MLCQLNSTKWGKVKNESWRVLNWGNTMDTRKSSAKWPPLLEVSLDAAIEACVVKEMTDGLVELDWCTVIGVKPGTRNMGTSSHL